MAPTTYTGVARFYAAAAGAGPGNPIHNGRLIAELQFACDDVANQNINFVGRWRGQDLVQADGDVLPTIDRPLVVEFDHVTGPTDAPLLRAVEDDTEVLVGSVVDLRQHRRDLGNGYAGKPAAVYLSKGDKRAVIQKAFTAA